MTPIPLGNLECAREMWLAIADSMEREALRAPDGEDRELALTLASGIRTRLSRRQPDSQESDLGADALPDMLTPKQVAECVGLSYHAVLRAIRRGELQALEVVPRRLRIDRKEYERWRMAELASPKARGAAPAMSGHLAEDHEARSMRRRDTGYAAELRQIEIGDREAAAYQAKGGI